MSVISRRLHERRLVRLCSLFRAISVVAACAIAGSTLIYPFVISDYFSTGGSSILPGPHIRYLYIFADLISDVAPVVVLTCLYRLFGCFQRGTFFDTTQVRLVSRIGFWLLIHSFLLLITGAVKDALLRTQDATFRMQISVDGYNFALLCAAATCFALSFVMREGMAFRRDSDLTI